jgi:glyceraldehyde 3-phosphate dehydrogenase
MAVKVGINGLGRIGRAAFKVILDTPELELVGVNDIAALENIVYLLKYDTVYGRYEREVEARDGKLIVDGREIAYLSQKDPTQLGWGDLGVELVFESTGIFTKQEDAAKHIQAGARYVIISGPTSSENVPTVVHGVNRPGQDAFVVSCASCTTNNITPIMEIIGRHFGVEKAIMTTVHAYTATQLLVDGPGGKKDMRRGRAAAQNWVPSSTGAATAAAKALPELHGLFDGVAVRGPVAVGSLADIVLLTKQNVTAEQVNQVLTDEANSPRYQGILGVADEELVSSDIIKDPRASIVQLDMTRVVDGNLLKIMTWYDNEWGYTNQMVKTALHSLGLREYAY